MEQTQGPLPKPWHYTAVRRKLEGKETEQAQELGISTAGTLSKHPVVKFEMELPTFINELQRMLQITGRGRSFKKH